MTPKWYKIKQDDTSPNTTRVPRPRFLEVRGGPMSMNETATPTHPLLIHQHTTYK